MKKFLTGIFFTAWVALGFVACDDVDPLVNELDPDRQFTPTRVTTVNGQTQVTIQWNASLFTVPGEVSYVVEISKDQTFSSVDYTTTVDVNQVVISNNNIAIKQDHYARIKATGANGRGDSGWVISGVFRILGEQILLAVQDADKSNNSVTLRWNADGNVTKITLTAEGSEPTDYEISTGEQAAKAKHITGLTPGTSYGAEIFNGETSRGAITFTTFSLEVPDADRIIYLGAEDVFTQNTFDTLTGTSVTFVFLQGSMYGTANGVNLTLKNNMDINFFGEPGTQKPVLNFNQLILPGVAGKIRFENVDLTGYPDGVSGTKRAYIFNQSTATQTTEIAFENCIIRNFENTPLRLQLANPITIDNFKINNSVVYDISTGGQNYALIHTNVATGIVNNIELTNSTFYNIKIGLILHNAAPSQSVVISNNTIDDISADTRAIVDYNTQTVGTFTFTSNILGKTKGGGANTVRGIRIGGASVSVPATNYTTSDHLVGSNPIGGVTAYSGSSVDLFTAPATGQFSFKDMAFAGKSTTGDPRWRQ